MKLVENKIGENSIWKDYQGPMLVLLAAMVWFVLYVNQDQVGDVFPILTALSTGVPMTIKLIFYLIPGKKVIE